MVSSLRPSPVDTEIDVSTPEGEAVMRVARALALEIRENLNGPVARKLALYERTLGLAVIPVLIRRALIAFRERRRTRRRTLR